VRGTVRGIVAVVLFLACVVLIVAIVYIAATEYVSDPCAGVDASAISEQERTTLIDRGYKGDPYDGRERLYPPGCLTTEER
jgi:hypothetical protein